MKLDQLLQSTDKQDKALEKAEQISAYENHFSVYNPAEEKVIRDNLREHISREFSRLNTREQDIITKCYGLNGDPIPLKNIAAEYNISCGRIGQIRDRALRKLSQSAELKQFFVQTPSEYQLYTRDYRRWERRNKIKNFYFRVHEENKEKNQSLLSGSGYAGSTA